MVTWSSRGPTCEKIHFLIYFYLILNKKSLFLNLSFSTSDQINLWLLRNIRPCIPILSGIVKWPGHKFPWSPNRTKFCGNMSHGQRMFQKKFGRFLLSFGYFSIYLGSKNRDFKPHTKNEPFENFIIKINLFLFK